MNNNKPQLHVWLLSDDKPGHYNQSLGLIRALEQRYLVRQSRIHAKLRYGFLRGLLRLLANRASAGRGIEALNRACHLAYEPFAMPQLPPDLILSCGGQTSYLNILLAQQFDVPNLFLGTLRGLKPERFSAVVSGLFIPNIPNLVELTLSPGLSTGEQMEMAGYRLRESFGLQDAELWALLIGGDGAGYVYRDADFQGLLDGLVRLAQVRGIRWLLTTSRRTKPAHERMIISTAARYPEVFADLVAYHQDPQKVVQSYLGAADVVFCSEDSSSMLSEAISAAKPVFSLSPAKAKPNANYREFLHKHTEAGRLMCLPMRSFAQQLLDEPLEQRFTPLDHSLDEQILAGVLPVLERKAG